MTTTSCCRPSITPSTASRTGSRKTASTGWPNRFAAQGMSADKGTRKLLKIVGECEQDDRNPWNREQLRTKMDPRGRLGRYPAAGEEQRRWRRG